ncbi:TerC/Alx family metal homeostasis membrane protein [uncultured Polaribacter sp.]|uniref:TerC/Alx family metal homeostasis membrane protein n=1 Tax=uncultured Polaribacter sp. TaxID=174711 RepID=UPI0030D8A82B|tara:strand:- start:32218 stop:33156 length:939 start_codon:yes stop_codon:yes gene_type:complete
MENYTPWIVLISYLLALLLIDFFVFHKKNQVTSVKKAVLETIFFITNAIIFSGLIYWFYDSSLIDNVSNLKPNQAVVKYLTGYIIELSLSVDNLFVIAIIFTSFKIPNQHQHKLLFLGILGAIVFRAILISVGLILLNKIHGMNIIFGLFLLFTALKMLKKEAEHTENEEPKGIMKLFRFSKELHGGKYITKVNGKTVFTALFGALITIELTDLLFALDSIPAIFAVTTDPFIVYSSNMFAIMGLRSLYFFLANMLDKFSYLKYSVFAILVFVSIKLMTASLLTIPEWFSLLFIGVSLSIGIYISTIKINEQ